MGVVYLAYDPKLDRGVALKVLRPDSASADRSHSRDRLLREAQVMASLSHPNVVPVYDVGQVDNQVFVAMEYVEGDTLGQWLERERPAWPRVLEVFRAAGLGLAAAHAQGLVHRDFKPENVMLDGGRRPRVMDFGLARPAEEEPDPEASTRKKLRLDDSATEASDSISRSLHSSVSSSSSLTRTGFVLGTPAYMAPEQHLGESLDPASDQFSFCVALFEALYGTRPFEGKTAAELCSATVAGTIVPAPAGSRVPSWLRRVVVRGLAPKPAQRFASMDALLSALAPRRTPLQRMGASVPAVVLLSGAIGGTAWWQTQQQQDPCAASEDALARSWSEAHSSAIRASFAATDLAFAEDTAERAIERIDAWGHQWIEEHRDACEATHVRHEQSEAGLDLRMQCLRSQRRALEGLVAVFGSAQQSTVEHWAATIDELSSPTRCADLEALQAEVPPPEDPAVRQQVEDVRASLHHVQALFSAARFDEARTATDKLRHRIEGLDYPPLAIELSIQHGSLLEKEGELDQARDTLVTAAWDAESLGMDRIVATTATRLVWVSGVQRSDVAAGERWAQLATAKLERLGEAPRLRAQLLGMRGGLADANGDYTAAAAHFEEALAIWEAVDPNGAEHANALGNYGKIHYRAGRLTEAAQTFEKSAETLALALGPHHPDVGKTWSNAAAARHALGEYERAREGFESSLAVLEKALGPDHIAVAKTLSNLGSVYFRLGDYEAAIERGRRAVAIQEASFGKDYPRIGYALNNIAMAQSKQGNHVEALGTYRTAETQLDALGPDHVALIEPLIGQGEELLHLARPAEAIVPLRRAYERQRSEQHDPSRLALPAFLLARALWSGGGDPNAARELAKEAAAALTASTASTDKRLAQAIERWLAEHPGG